MAAKIIDGKKIAGKLHRKTAEELEQLKLRYKTTPSITTIKIGEDQTSALYLTPFLPFYRHYPLVSSKALMFDPHLF